MTTLAAIRSTRKSLVLLLNLIWPTFWCTSSARYLIITMVELDGQEILKRGYTVSMVIVIIVLQYNLLYFKVSHTNLLEHHGTVPRKFNPGQSAPGTKCPRDKVIGWHFILAVLYPRHLIPAVLYPKTITLSRVALYPCGTLSPSLYPCGTLSPGHSIPSYQN